jgi:serine/threonine-protein kinase
MSAPDLKTIFVEALGRPPGVARLAYLEEACRGDAALRSEVEAMLGDHERIGRFLASAHESVPDDATAPLEPGSSSTLGELAEALGGLPRVLLRDTAADGAGEGQPAQADLAEMPPGARTGRYELFGEIARGGMGAVLRARDPDLGRELAVKVLLERHRENPDLLRRFIEEAQVGGQLQHPGIVPVYDVGSLADRRPFFAMRLVRGRTLAELLSGRAGPTDELPRFLGIFAQVCQTMAYAHARGVIHRDLKPSNVMVGSFGETQVMDWGLAKVLPGGGAAEDEKAEKAHGQETVITTGRASWGAPEASRPGSALGTPAYMAPEQARGERDRVDERVDVFALGSVLCELLTGGPAFLGRSTGEILRKAALGDTADVVARLGACGADIELVAIALNCLAREADDRPRHAGVVAERVSAFLAGVQERLRAAEIARAAESARAEEALERARAERRARRFQVGLAASLLVLATSGGLIFAYLLQERQRRETRLGQVLAEAKALQDKARRQPGEPALWRDALAAVERALGQVPEDRIEPLRREIKDGLDEAERDAALRQQLVEIRANQQDVGAQGTDADYATAFATAGLDLEAFEPAEFARLLRQQGEAAAIELAAFLDNWSAVRREAGRPVASWRRPLEAARLADPEPYRDRLRGILLAEDRKPQSEALKNLAAAPEAADLPAATVVLLASTLTSLDQADAAVGVLRLAVGRFPGDVWVNYALAGALDSLRPPAREEAVRYYTAARALRPETAHELAHLLERIGRGAESEAVFRDLVVRRPQNSRHLGCLGMRLKAAGRSDAATFLDRAVDSARVAIRLKPGDVGAHVQLGNALSSQGKLPEAIDAYREALRLKPGEAIIHDNIGIALVDQGKLPEAVAAYRDAIRLKPDDAEVHNHLGIALAIQGKLPEAIVEFREQIRLKPDDANGHYSLGYALATQRTVPEAIAEFREAIRLRPGFAEPYGQLGLLLQRQGQFRESLASIRKAHELGSKRPSWPYPSADWVRQAERKVALEARLPAVIRGDEKPEGAAEKIEFAELAYNSGRHAPAARLYAAALALEPKLGDNREAAHRYNAACAAARAGVGQGKDDLKPDDGTRSKLRGQALDWLKAELAAWAHVLDSADASARPALAQTLENWRTEADLAGVRDQGALAMLPQAEQAAWRALWAEVDALLARARGGSRP